MNKINNNTNDVEILDDNKPIRKKKLKKQAYFLFLIPLIIVGIIVYKIIDNKLIEQKRLLKEKEDQELLEDIKSHYSKTVITNNKTNLYIKGNDEYRIIGDVYESVLLNLDEQDINLDTKYFKLENSDYYIRYQDINKTEEVHEQNERYKKYLPFNENIVTKDKFTLFLDNKEMYAFNESMEFPIIIKDYEDKYYVEYDNMLMNIKKDDVEKIIKKENTKKKNQSKITTLAYHRVYDTNEKCTDPYCCIKKSSFEQEMKYLKDNNYLTLTLDELYMYLKGNLQVEKATVLTFDDGYLYKSADEVLDKYELNGTIFVISSFFNDLTQFNNLKRLQVQSHTHNMHRNYVCSGGSQGGAILCASESAIKSDLETSLEKLGVKPIGLAFPFYDYNDKAIKVLKQVGFKMSFIGRAGVMGKATPNKTDLYKIPRMTVWEQNLMSFNTWKSYL